MPRITTNSLYYLIYHKHIIKAEKLIKANPNLDLDIKNEYDNTILHVSVRREYQNLVYLILENKANVNAVNLYNKTPLHLAGHHQNINIFKLLFEKGADPHIVDCYNKTPIYYFVNNLKCVSNLPNSMTIQKTAFDIIMCFVEKGIDLNTKIKKNKTLLDLLHDKKYNKTLEYIELSKNSILDQVKLDKDRNNYINLIHYFILYNLKDKVFEALNNGLDVNQLNDVGFTLAHTALYYNKFEIVCSLIDYGIDVNIPDLNGVTLLHIVSMIGNLDIFMLLLKHHANVNCEDKNKFTPLHYASYFRQDIITSILIHKGADVNSINRFGMMPIHLASIQQHFTTVKILISNDSLYDVMDGFGNYPIHCVLYGRKINNNETNCSLILNYFISSNLFVNRKNKYGKSVYDLAIEYNFHDIILLLIHFDLTNYK